jgi:hypothetical protein
MTIETIGPLNSFNQSQPGEVLRGPSEAALASAYEQYAKEGNLEPTIYFSVVLEYEKELYIVPVWATIIGYLATQHQPQTKLIAGQIWIPNKPHYRGLDSSQKVFFEGEYNVWGRLGRIYFGDLERIRVSPGMVLLRTDAVVPGYNGLDMILPGRGKLVRIRKFSHRPTDAPMVVTDSWSPDHNLCHEQWFEPNDFLRRYFQVLPDKLGETVWQEHYERAIKR